MQPAPYTPYTRMAITLHGAMALLMVAGFSIGLYMVGLPLSPLKLQLYSYHKWIGVSVAAQSVLAKHSTQVPLSQSFLGSMQGSPSPQTQRLPLQMDLLVSQTLSHVPQCWGSLCKK